MIYILAHKRRNGGLYDALCSGDQALSRFVATNTPVQAPPGCKHGHQNEWVAVNVIEQPSCETCHRRL